MQNYKVIINYFCLFIYLCIKVQLNSLCKYFQILTRIIINFCIANRDIHMPTSLKEVFFFSYLSKLYIINLLQQILLVEQILIVLTIVCYNRFMFSFSFRIFKVLQKNFQNDLIKYFGLYLPIIFFPNFPLNINLVYKNQNCANYLLIL